MLLMILIVFVWNTSYHRVRKVRATHPVLYAWNISFTPSCRACIFSMIHSFFGLITSFSLHEKIQFSQPCLPMFQISYFNHTSNPLVNEISVLQIEIRSFVELIKGYKIHYLGLNLKWVKMSKMAVWLGSTLKP